MRNHIDYVATFVGAFGAMLLFIGMMLLLAAPVVFFAISGAWLQVSGLFSGGCLSMGFSALFLAVNKGLYARRSWARMATLGIAALSILNLPVGTFFAAYAFWTLTKSEAVAEFV